MHCKIAGVWQTALLFSMLVFQLSDRLGIPSVESVSGSNTQSSPKSKQITKWNELQSLAHPKFALGLLVRVTNQAPSRRP